MVEGYNTNKLPSTIAVHRFIGAILKLNSDVYKLWPVDYATGSKAPGPVDASGFFLSPLTY
jgi:hypothetical protein